MNPVRSPVLLAAAALVLARCGGDEDGGAGGPADPASATAPGSPAVAVGTEPVGMTAGPDGDVWVVSAGDGTVARIPAGASGTDLEVDVPGLPLRAVAAYDAVWVTSFDRGLLLRVDPDEGRVLNRIRTGAEPEGVAAGHGSVWVVTQGAGDLVRVDPRSGRVVGRTDVGPGARLVTAGADLVHVAHFDDGRVLAIDPRTGRVVADREVCDGPQGMAEAHGLLWVACTSEDAVVALDPESVDVEHRVDVAGQPDSVVATDDGSLLVVAEEGPTLVRIEPASASVAGSLPLSDKQPLFDEANLDIALAGDQAWVSSYVADVVHHVPVDDVPR